MEPIVAPMQQEIQRLRTELLELKAREEKLRQENNTEALVKSCISGDLKEVKRLVDQKTDVNRPDSTGMTPLLGAYWGLNLDVIQLLGTCGVVGITGEQADQELEKMGKYDVVGEFKKVDTYGKWYEWIQNVDRLLFRSAGVQGHHLEADGGVGRSGRCGFLIIIHRQPRTRTRLLGTIWPALSLRCPMEKLHVAN
jgi:hypothetical protein